MNNQVNQQLKTCPKCGLPCQTYERRSLYFGTNQISLCCKRALPKAGAK